jgi:hypothetical protein
MSAFFTAPGDVARNRRGWRSLMISERPANTLRHSTRWRYTATRSGAPTNELVQAHERPAPVRAADEEPVDVRHEGADDSPETCLVQRIIASERRDQWRDDPAEFPDHRLPAVSSP